MSGGLSWLDAKTMWLCLVVNIAAGCRSLSSQSWKGREGRWYPVGYVSALSDNTV